MCLYEKDVNDVSKVDQSNKSLYFDNILLCEQFQDTWPS